MSLAAQTVAARAEVREKTGAPRSTPRAFADFHIHTRFSRDSILSEEEQAENRRVMICCAGCKSERLVLDL